jgi:hypothetical protein
MRLWDLISFLRWRSQARFYRRIGKHLDLVDAKLTGHVEKAKRRGFWDPYAVADPAHPTPYELRRKRYYEAEMRFLSSLPGRVARLFRRKK